jgi:hypothetical protein
MWFNDLSLSREIAPFVDEVGLRDEKSTMMLQDTICRKILQSHAVAVGDSTIHSHEFVTRQTHTFDIVQVLEIGVAGRNRLIEVTDSSDARIANQETRECALTWKTTDDITLRIKSFAG